MAPPETGIIFSNRLADTTVAQNRLLELGSGVALGDVDGDGLVDVYFCRLEGDNVLYRNLGDWKFEDITAAAAVGCPNQYSTGCVLADLDGDGDLDLLVNSLGGGTRGFLNNGRGRFTEAPQLGLANRSGATSMALGDVDSDGDLDLYVTNYRTDTFHDPPRGVRIESRRLPDGTSLIEPRDRFLGIPTRAGGVEVLERGEPDVFYINKGGTNFVAAPWNVGVFLNDLGEALSEAPRDWGLAVLFRDLNGDHLPDLFVCNDFVYWTDRMWLNQGGRRFQAPPRMALRNSSLSSMSIDVADLDRDGHDDFFVAEMLSPGREDRARQRPDTLENSVRWPVEKPEFRPEFNRNTLQRSRGDGTWAEIAPLAGLAATDWTWAVAFMDVDLDGWEDLLLTTGNNHDVQDADVQAAIIQSGGWKSPERRLQSLAQLPRRLTPLMAFRNRHDLTFQDTSAAWHFDQRGIAHGIALADLDNDGDLDVVINSLNEPARLLRNDGTAPRLAVRLKGARGNTRGINATLKVTGGPVTQTQEMIAGGRYLSGDDALRVFAAGTATALDVEVTWRSGRRSVVRGLKPNQVVEIAEEATLDPAPLAPTPPALFEDAQPGLNHVQTDAEFDDFGRQPLLHRRLGTPGPGVSWGDLDGDGDDDLVIGAGRGGAVGVYRNDGAVGFVSLSATNALEAAHDHTSMLVEAHRNGGARWIAGASNWEDASTSAPRFEIHPLGAVATPSSPSPASGTSATGPLALADTDGDGDLDLLVGARARAGRYPEPGETLLLRNEGGTFTEPVLLTKTALVNGAVFSDLDADGDPDLVLACEWDSLRYFRNDAGALVEATGESGLGEFKGLWNGVTTGDFDGDGRLDLVASNWGRNWRSDPPQDVTAPVQLVFGEWGEPGVVHSLLVSRDPTSGRTMPWRSWDSLVAAIPTLGERVRSHRDFGRLNVRELLGPLFERTQTLSAGTFDSMVFLNRGGRFEAHSLPTEAQFAPAFGVSVADFDGDGNEDVFLAQNFFGVDVETSRQDAGTGLVLLGDGRGEFRPLPPKESGFSLYGEQRGSAVADYDGDGRVDLVVGQNAGPTRLLHNRSGIPGVRVTLSGPEFNPTAVGAVLRLHLGTRRGPAREIHAGSGYLSQDSAIPVLATPEPPTALEIRWPGGRLQTLPWPSGSKSVEVTQ
ncbi:MAG: hypothetical protein RIS76_1168 [Verrucomicrobiota bacterium]|jgi:hypothetical protein